MTSPEHHPESSTEWKGAKVCDVGDHRRQRCIREVRWSEDDAAIVILAILGL